MIILDTSILRSFGPESSSADLLCAIRAVGAEEVAVPWMVMEELAAQQAIKYQEKFEVAAQALESLQHVTPWELELSLGPCELEPIRDHWRKRWGPVVGTIPTSDEALRQAAFREANSLAPCKAAKGAKTGSRDAAIWLSAVEYARLHPDEIVYFVSANTRDFSDGSSHPSPMREDIAGMENRLVHLTSMDDIANRFTEPAPTDEGLVVSILKSPQVLDEVTASSGTYFSTSRPFECCVAMGPSGEPEVVRALSWVSHWAALSSVESSQTYRIGDHEWCTAVVHWDVAGTVMGDSILGSAGAGCRWTAAVLFTPDPADPRLTVLRAGRPRPLSADEFSAFEVPPPLTASPLEQAIQESIREGAADVLRVSLRLPRAYEGALKRGAGRPHMGDSAAG